MPSRCWLGIKSYNPGASEHVGKVYCNQNKKSKRTERDLSPVFLSRDKSFEDISVMKAKPVLSSDTMHFSEKTDSRMIYHKNTCRCCTLRI